MGLGNPGAAYQATRHNVGFRVLDVVYERVRGAPWRSWGAGLLTEVGLGGVRFWLLKPQTFMNHSGRCVPGIVSMLGIGGHEILTVHDDLDLPLGRLRLKRDGGDGGHNGVRSVAESLGGAGFARLRVGIGRPPPDFLGDTAQFVLEAFAPSERAELEILLDRAADAVQRVVQDGLDAAMNVVNRRDENQVLSPSR